MIDYWILEKSVVTNHGVIKDTISSKHFYPNTLNYVYQYFLKKKKKSVVVRKQYTYTLCRKNVRRPLTPLWLMISHEIQYPKFIALTFILFYNFVAWKSYRGTRGPRIFRVKSVYLKTITRFWRNRREQKKRNDISQNDSFQATIMCNVFRHADTRSDQSDNRQKKNEKKRTIAAATRT